MFELTGYSVTVRLEYKNYLHGIPGRELLCGYVGECRPEVGISSIGYDEDRKREVATVWKGG